MLTPDKVRYENGVRICEKIIPDGVRATKYIASWVPKGGLVKPNKKMDPIGITLHNTQDLKGTYDDAEQYTRATYPNGNMAGAVVHYYVDDTCAWQNLKEDEPGWHASDNDGDGNRRTIAIECIMDGSGSVEDLGARDNAARLIAAIMKRHNWNLSNLYTHNHWMGQPDKIVYGVRKNCPVYILPNYDDFKNLVLKYLGQVPVTENTVVDDGTLKFKDISEGDILYFKGTSQYVHSGKTAKPVTATPSKVKVLKKYVSSAAHPISVRSINDKGVFTSKVYGWVDISDLERVYDVPYRVRVTADSLNIRSKSNSNSSIVGKITDKGVYTIVDVENGWGLLKAYQKNRNGWIYLNYTKKF